MEFAMGMKMFKRSITMGLLAFITVFLMAGCKSLGKEEAKPDRFEKWRALAEESRGQTPDPKQYDMQLKEKEKIEQIKQEALAPKPRVSEPPVKVLPRMAVTMKMHDVPLSVLLRTLAKAADVNMMINETVTGNANINIDNIPWSQAFTGLLNTYGLTYKWSDNVLRIITVEDLNKEIALMEATQKFEKSKKEHAIAMLTIQKEEEKLDPLFTEIIKIDYADLVSLRDNLEQYLSTSKKEADIKKTDAKDGKAGTEATEFRGCILMDASTSSLIIQATQSDIRKIMPIIQKLDRPTHQILIEAHIVEANSDTAKELGIQWGGLGQASSSDNKNWIGGPLGTFDKSLYVSSDDATETAPAGTPITHLPNIASGINFPSSENAGTAGWQGMALGLMTQHVGDFLLYAQLTALEKEGKLNILSKPSITTMDNRKAIIESGKEVPFQTIEDGEIKIEFKKAVIKLEVVPHVIDDKSIRLRILTHKDELDWTRTVAGNPTIITKNAETEVYLYDGQTTVIGGLNKEKIEDTESGVPLLKDVPGLGRLFKSNSDTTGMEELLIFLTPHILDRKAPVADNNKD
jgi:type IV pilus assembly protein PilQ